MEYNGIIIIIPLYVSELLICSIVLSYSAFLFPPFLSPSFLSVMEIQLWKSLILCALYRFRVRPSYLGVKVGNMTETERRMEIKEGRGIWREEEVLRQTAIESAGW